MRLFDELSCQVSVALFLPQEIHAIRMTGLDERGLIGKEAA